jgi:hypothetical protein
MPFIRLIIIFGLLFLAVRAIGRLLFPGSRNQSFNRKQKDEEGDISINDSSRKQKKYGRDEGEYVDYEELE